MTFQEKLRRLAPTVNKSRAARAVGLKENAISTYMAKGSLPRIDIALKIATALNVPLDWLADDRRDWPPPMPVIGAVENIQDGFLMREVCRRLRLASMDVKELIDKAERIDWREVARQLLNQPVDSPFPQSIAPEIELARSLLFADGALRKYQASDAIKAHWRYLPPVELPQEDLDFRKLLQRLDDLNRRPGCGATQFYLFLLATERERPEPARVLDARNKLRAEMEKLEGSTEAKESPGKSEPKPGGDADGMIALTGPNDGVSAKDLTVMHGPDGNADMNVVGVNSASVSAKGVAKSRGKSRLKSPSKKISSRPA
ncbi:MAG: helix-turn-helix transcriptional regulator [Tepidisphaeraceae bacterium]|jgi:transcriptional regulator with XRE-family HTH domain